MPIFESIGIHERPLADILGKVSWKPAGAEEALRSGLIESRDAISAFKQILEVDANVRGLVVSHRESPAGMIVTLDPHLLDLVGVEAGRSYAAGDRAAVTRSR